MCWQSLKRKWFPAFSHQGKRLLGLQQKSIKCKKKESTVGSKPENPKDFHRNSETRINGHFLVSRSPKNLLRHRFQASLSVSSSMMNTTEPNGWLQTNAPENNVGGSSTTEATFSDQNLDSLVFLAIAVVTLIFLFVVFNREFYLRKHGVDIFGFGCRSRRLVSQTRLESDRAFAEELQRRLNEEEREAERITKRDERRLWYESYIEAFTMVRDRRNSWDFSI